MADIAASASDAWPVAKAVPGILIRGSRAQVRVGHDLRSMRFAPLGNIHFARLTAPSAWANVRRKVRSRGSLVKRKIRS